MNTKKEHGKIDWTITLVQKKSWTYIKNNANMVVLTFSWNFNSAQ